MDNAAYVLAANLESHESANFVWADDPDGSSSTTEILGDGKLATLKLKICKTVKDTGSTIESCKA